LELSLKRAKGRLVWSDRVELPFETLLEALDEIVAHIGATVIGRLGQTDIVVA
jgi:adenylate cyclase